MADDLDQLNAALAAMMAGLGPSGRAKAAKSIARTLRGTQAKRIAAQRDPDGRPFAPRKQAVKAPAQKVASPKLSKGRALTRRSTVRSRLMFRKLRTFSQLKQGGDASGAWVGFRGRAAQIAAIHQEGLLDRPSPKSRLVRYAQRVLLGLTEAERQAILETMMAQVYPD